MTWKKTIIILSVLLLFFIVIVVLAQPSIRSEQEARILIEQKISNENSDSYILGSDCVLVLSEEQQDYFYIEYHEKHSDDCPGDPQTSPLISMYRVSKFGGVVEKYDIINDNYILLK